jgi:hypothetical protein
MASDYRIQIVRNDGGLVHTWAPGGALERDLVEMIIEKVKGKGVGIGKTEASVLGSVRDAIHSALYDLKAAVKP